MQGSNIQKLSNSGEQFCQIVEHVFTKCDSEEIRQFVALARRLWLRRNDVVFGRAFIHPNTLIHEAKRAVENFSTANENGKAQVLATSITHTEHWAGPQTGWLKVNWDVSVQKTKGVMGFGVVVRDDAGLVVAAAC